MTLGPALLVPPWFDNRPPAWTRPLIEYGRVPFFYFFAHFSRLHAAAAVTVLVRYGSWHWMFESTGMGSYPFTRPPDWGYPLPVVSAVWIAVVVSLYPACKWMAKATRRYPRRRESHMCACKRSNPSFARASASRGRRSRSP